MSRETLIFVIGFLLIVIPFLGIPIVWKEYVLAGLGVLVFILGYQLRRSAYARSIERESGERVGDAFVERVPQQHVDV